MMEEDLDRVHRNHPVGVMRIRIRFAQPTTKPQVTDMRVQLGSGHGERRRERARPPGDVRPPPEILY